MDLLSRKILDFEYAENIVFLSDTALAIQPVLDHLAI